MISLADLRARNVVPAWQEAVAVVQELLHTTVTTTGSPDRLPDLEHVALIANGDVVALPGSLRPDNPVRHLAILLQLLTEHAAVPEELAALVEANVVAPPQHATVEAFSQALAFFERPGRKADIEQLVARALEAEAETRADEELERLKAKALQAAERGKPSEEEPAASRRSDLRLPLALTAAALFIFALAGVYYWRVTSAGAADQPQRLEAQTTKEAGGAAADAASSSLLDRARQGLSAAVQAAKESLGASQTEGAEAPAAPPEPEAAQGPVRRAAVPSARGSAAAPPAPSPRPTEMASVVTDPIETNPDPASVARVTDRVDGVYNEYDADVLPPVLVRPTMPEAPPANVPPERLGVLDMLIDENGDVERVRLIAVANRYQERMFVSHAKTWKFQPAMRDGLPVKYRMRIRLTI